MPRRIGIPYRIIQPITVPIERLRIARRPTLAPGLGRHRIAWRDGQRASTGHDAIRADKAPHPRIIVPGMVKQEARVVQLLPRQAVEAAADRAFLLVQAEGVAGGDAGAAPKG